MLKTARDKATCAKYSARQTDGKVRCNECPLVKDTYNCLCKANSTYNPWTRQWEPDERKEAQDD